MPNTILKENKEKTMRKAKIKGDLAPRTSGSYATGTGKGTGGGANKVLETGMVSCSRRFQIMENSIMMMLFPAKVVRTSCMATTATSSLIRRFWV